MKKRVRCFEEEIDRSSSYGIMDAGLRVVETGRIVGTVDKCGELDRHFQYLRRRDRNERSRRYAMYRALQEHQFLPPVELYLLRGDYYVVDGNRRVATAKDMKIEFIDAHVTEYVFRKHSLDMGGVMARRRFEVEAGITTIVLNNESGYRTLLSEIEGYAGGGDIEARARRWLSKSFRPACASIEKSGLPVRYPDLRVGDIYVLVSDFYRTYLDGIPEESRYESLISGFTFAHGIRRRRPFHFPFFRMMSAAVLKMGLRGE
jgi:hypothetical protein